MRIRESRAASQKPATPTTPTTPKKTKAKLKAEPKADETDPPTQDETSGTPTTSATPKKERKKREPKVKKTTKVAENGQDKAKADAEGDKEAKGEEGQPPKTEEAAKKKDPYTKLKKCLPPWAGSEQAHQGLKKKMTRTPLALFKEAFEIYADKQGVASLPSMRAFFHHETDWTNQALKKKLEKAIAANQLLLVKGKGLTGHYKLLTEKKSLQRDKVATTTPSKSKSKGRRGAAKMEGPVEPLENHFGYIFMWATNPKEASVSIIKKYVSKHFPMLDAESGLRKALEHGEADGKYKRITGKGMSGTLQLMDGADKSGQLMDDAIEDAFIAMNEPKEVSVTTLRDYLDEYHPEYRTNVRPMVLKKALDRAEARGWIDRITGKGFSGTFRLAHSYYPGPLEVWGKWFEGHKGYLPKDTDAKKVKPKFTFADEDDFTDEDEPEYIPRKRKRTIWDPSTSSTNASRSNKKKRRH